MSSKNQESSKSGQSRLPFGNRVNLAVKPQEKIIKKVKGAYVKENSNDFLDIKAFCDPEYKEQQQIEQFQRYERLKKAKEIEEAKKEQQALLAEEAARVKIEFNTKCQLYADFFDKDNSRYQKLSEMVRKRIFEKYGESVAETIDRVEDIFLNQI